MIDRAKELDGEGLHLQAISAALIAIGEMDGRIADAIEALIPDSLEVVEEGEAAQDDSHDERGWWEA